MPVITSYDAILGSAVADSDIFLVVDVSDTSMAATGTDKKITKSEMPFLSSDYETAIGKVDISGDYPILFDPAGASEANAWWRIEYVQAPKQIGLFLEAAEDASGSHILFRYTGADTGVSGSRTAFFDGFAQSDDSVAYTDVAFQSSVNSIDSFGYARNAYVTVFSDLTATGWIVEATETHLKQVMQAYAGQTDPLLDLQDSATTSIFSIAPDGKVGGVAPSVGDSIKWNGTKWAAAA